MILNSIKAWIVKPVENFKNLKTQLLYFICWPASLPTVRPTSSSKIGPVFLTIQNIDTLAYTDLLFQLSHCAMVSPFILYCFPFSLTGEWKGEKSLKIKGVNELYGLYLLHGQMHVYLISSSVKIITKSKVFVVYQFKSARMVSC